MLANCRGKTLLRTRKGSDRAQARSSAPQALFLSALAAVFFVAAEPVFADEAPALESGSDDHIAACNAAEQTATKIECFLSAAEAAGDPEACTLAEAPSVRFNCLALYAERTRDVQPCGMIDSGGENGQALQDACIAGVAVATSDLSLCETTKIEVLRDACFMTLITEHDMDRALCNHISQPTLRSACSDDG